MTTEIAASKLLNRLDLADVLLVLAILLGARLVSGALRWSLRQCAERAPAGWRLGILKFMPITRLLIGLAAVIVIVPIVIQPTLQNVVTLIAGVGLALAFALKDLGSSLIAGLVTVLEGVYQPGDWIEVDGAYGEVRSVGLRAVRIVTLEDTEVIIPHTKLWSTSIHNASSGNHHILCVAHFYVDPRHDAAKVRAALEAIASQSPYWMPGSESLVVVEEQPWGTHYKVKAYVNESRDQAAFVSDLTVRGKTLLQQLDVPPARVGVAPR